MSPDSEILLKLERIASAGIQILPVPELTAHFVFERDGYAVIVERREDGFGGIGSPGRITSRGFAALVERNGQPVFIFKDEVQAASVHEAQAARQLFTDLKSALA